MKKFAIVLIIALCTVGALFATDSESQEAFTPPTQDKYDNVLSSTFTKTSARISAMGGAGLAVFNNQDSLYINPASLGAKGLVFNTPNVAVTLYNIKDAYVDTGLLENVIKDPNSITDMDYLTGELLPGVIGVLGASGYNKLATVDAGIGFKAGRFAFAVDSQVNLNTYVPFNGGTADLQVIPQVDVAATMGIGIRFMRDKAFNIDVGVSAALQMRAFMQSFNAMDALDSFNSADENFDPASLFNTKPIAIGWAVPLTVGVNINMPFGFTIANVVSNIQLVNGGYNYVFQDSYENFIDDPMGVFENVFTGPTSFVAETPFCYSVGFGWSPDLGGWEWLIDPTVAIDVVDVVGLFENLSTNSFLSRLKVGAELQFFKFLELRGGLNSGYVSLGAGINLFNVIHLEASYYWNEFGDVLGGKDVDALTIRFNILWER